MRFLNYCFVILFIVILLLPLIFVDLSKNRVSVQENRMLANFPDMNDLKHHQGQFIHDFDKWFKDSTGFRKQLISLYNGMGMNTWMNNVMYKKGNDVYLIGENGHHFYAGENGFLIRRFQGESIFSDEQLAKMASKLEGVKVFLEGKGIPLVVMFCPFKEEIYYEYYPKSIKRGPEPTQFDLITKYLQEHTDIDVFNIKQALMAEKDNYMLYPVSSGDLEHYTEIGAFFAYRDLMKHINVYFPYIVPFNLNDIVISYEDKYINMLPNVTLKKEQSFKKLDPSFFDDVELIRPFIWENVAYENKNPDLPVILIFRDSYSYFDTIAYGERKFLTQFLASHFSKAVFIHWNSIKHYQEYVAKYKPDIVVIETGGGAIKYFANRVYEIPELETANRGSN